MWWVYMLDSVNSVSTTFHFVCVNIHTQISVDNTLRCLHAHIMHHWLYHLVHRVLTVLAKPLYQSVGFLVPEVKFV